MGTFGGAITINSPDWDRSVLSTSTVSATASAHNIKPFVIIVSNSFSNNMAYFSGNAIYIRNTQRSTDLTNICGSAWLDSNTFTNNIGTKKHNGGAVTASCKYLSDINHEDYHHTSSIYIADVIATGD